MITVTTRKRAAAGPTKEKTKVSVTFQNKLPVHVRIDGKKVRSRIRTKKLPTQEKVKKNNYRAEGHEQTQY